MLKRFCISENTALVRTVMAVTASLYPADIDIRPSGIAGSQNNKYFVFESLILLAHPYTAANSVHIQLCV